MGKQLTIKNRFLKELSSCVKKLWKPLLNCVLASADEYNFLNYHKTTNLCNTAEISGM